VSLNVAWLLVPDSKAAFTLQVLMPKSDFLTVSDFFDDLLTSSFTLKKMLGCFNPIWVKYGQTQPLG